MVRERERLRYFLSRPLRLLISVPAFPVPPQDDLLPSHSLPVPLSVHSLTIISFPIVESFFPSHIPLEYDLSQSPPSNIRTKCCVDMHIQPGVSVVCCVFLPIHSGHQVRWTYQPGSHRRNVTGFFIHLLSAVRALIFLARRIQPFLSLVDREVKFLCTNDLIVLHPLGIFIFVF